MVTPSSFDLIPMQWLTYIKKLSEKQARKGNAESMLGATDIGEANRCGPSLRQASYAHSRPNISRAMIRRWISEVPSPISVSFTSRK